MGRPPKESQEELNVPFPRSMTNSVLGAAREGSELEGRRARAAPVLPSDPRSQLLPFRIVLGLPSYPATMHGCPPSIGMKRILQKQALHRVPRCDKPHYGAEIPT